MHTGPGNEILRQVGRRGPLAGAGPWRRARGGAAIVVCVALWSCEFFNDVEIGIPVTIENDIKFTVDDSVANLFEESGNAELLDRRRYPNNDEFPPLDELLEVTIPRDITIADDPDIKANRDKIIAVNVDYIELDIARNDLTHPIELIELFIGVPGTKGFAEGEGWIKFASLPGLAAGEKKKLRQRLDPADKEKLSKQLLKYNFAILARVLVRYNTLDNPNKPLGGADAVTRVRLVFLTRPAGGDG